MAVTVGDIIVKDSILNKVIVAMVDIKISL